MDDELKRQRNLAFRLRAWLNSPPGPAGEPIKTPVGIAALPRWALMAARRNEPIPGHLIAQVDRWNMVCPRCLLPVFLLAPDYLMPAWEEWRPEFLDAIWTNREAPAVNPVRIHEPCRFYDKDAGWAPWEEETIPKNLKDYL